MFCFRRLGRSVRSGKISIVPSRKACSGDSDIHILEERGGQAYLVAHRGKLYRDALPQAHTVPESPGNLSLADFPLLVT